MHKNYNEHLVTQANRSQLQEILNSQIAKTDKRYVNVQQKYKEKAPSVIEQMAIDKAEKEA